MLVNSRAKPADGGSRARPAARVRAFPARAAAAARRHWLAATLLAAGLALRVLAEVAYRPALFYIDTARYLYNAGGMDPVGYKALLRPVLLVANFDAVAAVQHLLGLAMATVIYLLLLRRGAPRWLAALAMAPVALDAYQVQAEQMIMPTALFEALILAGLAILLWAPEAGWRRVAAAGVVLGSSATVAQVGEALVVPAMIYVLASGGGWRHAARKAALLFAAFALPILAYCTGSYLAPGGAFYLSHTGATSFYGRTAAAADCPALTLPPAERAMCPTRAQQAMGADWLEYNLRSPIRPYYVKLPRNETDSLIIDFNRRVATQQPLRLLSAYLRDTLKPFALARTTSPGDPPISRWQFQTSFPYSNPHESKAVVQAAVDRFGGGAPAVWRPGAELLRAYQLGGGYTPGPLLAVFTLAALFASAGSLRRRADPRARQACQACLLLFTSGLFLLLVADLFEFSWRYQLPALVTLAPGGALAIGVVLRWLRRSPPRADGGTAGSHPVREPGAGRPPRPALPASGAEG